MSHTVPNYIAGLKLIDEQLHESITKRRAAHPDFQPKYDCTYLFDKECRVLFAGFLGAEQLGILPADIEGKRWRELGLPPAIVELFEKEIQSVFITGQPVIIDLPGGYSGSLATVHIEYMLNPLCDSKGDIGAVVCEVRDIIERKGLELQCLNDANILQLLIELCPLAIVMVDKECNITIANQAFLNMVPAAARAGLIGRPCKVAIDLLGIDYEKSAIYRALQGEGLALRHVVVLERDYLSNGVKIRDQRSGEVIGAMSVYHDITEHEQFRREIARLDRLNLIGEMAAGVAHEIRNPMTVIKGYLQFYQTKVPASMSEQFQRVLSELDRIETIIADFLSLAKTKVVERGQQNLTNIVQAIFPLIYSDAVKQGINVEMGLDTNLPDVLLDDKEIKQLILNLARNGLEAMSGNGTLTIKTECEGDVVHLSVSDCGCGIPKEVQSKILNPFFTTKSNGTGLGLSVCAGIVERHGGRIDIQSEQGQGTTVNVYFPINSIEGGVLPVLSSHRPTLKGGDRPVPVLLDLLLVRKGYLRRVKTANSGFLRL